MKSHPHVDLDLDYSPFSVEPTDDLKTSTRSNKYWFKLFLGI